MEIESFWYQYTSYPKQLKNQKFFGYGCMPKQRSKKRKVYRQYRRYGFDLSECWNLDYTFSKYLSDNIHGFFTTAGNSDQWDYFNEDDCKLNFISYRKHIEDFFLHEDKNKVQAAVAFLLPRLKYFRKHHHGYPPLVKTNDNWNTILDEIIYSFETHGKYSPLFVEYFFNLWD